MWHSSATSKKVWGQVASEPGVPQSLSHGDKLSHWEECFSRLQTIWEWEQGWKRHFLKGLRRQQGCKDLAFCFIHSLWMEEKRKWLKLGQPFHIGGCERSNVPGTPFCLGRQNGHTIVRHSGSFQDGSCYCAFLLFSFSPVPFLASIYFTKRPLSSFLRKERKIPSSSLQHTEANKEREWGRPGTDQPCLA